VTKYYDLSAADARVEELRTILEALRKDRDTIAKVQRSLEQAHGSNGKGESHDELDQRREQMASTIRRMEAAVRQLDAWGISLRDIGTGLVDFPALVNGRPIWLCWKLGESNIAWWHELDAGVAGRKPLIELE
jgi:hypothetical protein